MSQIYFTPEDFDNVFTIEELSKTIEQMIKDIRNFDITGKEIKEKIQQLEEHGEIIKSKDSSQVATPVQLLTIYEKIKDVSLSLRNLLQKYIPSLDVYNNISYAFYLDGKRYVSETINSSWVFTNSKGELRLYLDKAVDDLKKEYNSTYYFKIQEILQYHYQNYYNVIDGTYKDKRGIGHGRINRGHVAEAFETHMKGHGNHSKAYEYLNNPKIESTLNKMVLIQIENELRASPWIEHETVDEAWIHIKSALGTQRGTVAGDVGKWQVKSAISFGQYSSQVRLASLTTLRDGVNIYCDIVSNKPSKEVAERLARYLSEPVNKKSKEAQAYMANRGIAPKLNKLVQI